MNQQDLQTVTSHQRRIDEIDAALKMAEKFLDHKAFLLNEKGEKVLMTRAEMFELRAKAEEAIKKLQ